MKNVLIILDGQIAKHLIKRMVSLNNNTNQYDIVYNDDLMLPDAIPANFTFYKFDPTSYSKLLFVMNKVLYQDALIVLDSKDETIAVVENIRKRYNNLNFTIYDSWGLKFDDNNIKYYRGHDILSNGLVEQLPNIPVFAQNIGLRKGEIMEVNVPFGSNYAYRYIGGINQKDWKIIALYRNNKLLNVKPTSVLKPNDNIIIIGKPDVLIQVYNSISVSQRQFPMPFGNNLYIYFDMFIQTEKEILSALDDAKILHQRMKNRSLVVKITRPTTVDLLNKIEGSLKNVPNLIISMDYHNLGIQKILKQDKMKYDIGMLVLTQNILTYKEAILNIVSLKLPIFKIGKENISSLKSAVLLLNDNKDYEQISPVVFDIAGQLKIKTKVFDIDPIGDKQTEELVSHLQNLSKIFNQNITVSKQKLNPIKVLEKQQNILQVLPLKEEMFHRRRFRFFSTNSDYLSFDMNKFNQILIPVIDQID